MRPGINGADLTAAQARSASTYDDLNWTEYNETTKPYGWVLADLDLPQKNGYADVEASYIPVDEAGVKKITLNIEIADAQDLLGSIPTSENDDGADISTVDYWIKQVDYDTLKTP